MNKFTNTDYSIWTDKDLTPGQRNLLVSIESKADSLRRELNKVQNESAEALRRMANGQHAADGGWEIFGQSVRNAERLSAELQTLIEVSRGLVDVEKIQSAYAA